MPSLREPSRGLVLAAVAASCSLLATAALTGAALYRIATNAYGATGDFLSFYVAGFMVRTGRGADLYDPVAQEALQRAKYPGAFDYAIGYPLPVFAAWVFAPFSALPFTAAFVFWMALNAFLLGALAWGLNRYLRAAPAPVRAVFLAVFLTSMPAVAAIIFGQVDLIVFAGLFCGYLLHRDGRPVAAGAALSLALFKPHFLGGAVLMLLLWRDWRTLAALAGVALPLLTVPALLTSPSTLAANLSYVGKYPGADDNLSVNAELMSNWRGFVTSVTGHNEIWLWLPGLAVIALVALLFAARAWRVSAGDPSARDRSWALAAALPLLVSPHLHTQSLVLLFLAGAILLRARAAADASDPASRDRAISALLSLHAALFATWFAGTLGLATLVFVVLAVYALLALRWPPQVRAAAGLAAAA